MPTAENRQRKTRWSNFRPGIYLFVLKHSFDCFVRLFNAERPISNHLPTDELVTKQILLDRLAYQIFYYPFFIFHSLFFVHFYFLHSDHSGDYHFITEINLNWRIIIVLQNGHVVLNWYLFYIEIQTVFSKWMIIKRATKQLRIDLEPNGSLRTVILLLLWFKLIKMYIMIYQMFWCSLALCLHMPYAQCTYIMWFLQM